jgi:hypothetical protein
VLWIFESQAIGDFAKRLCCTKYPILGYIHDVKLDIFLRGLTGFFFDQIAKVVCRKAQVFGEIANCWQANGLIGFKVLIQKYIKCLDYSLVCLVPG